MQVVTDHAMMPLKGGDTVRILEGRLRGHKGTVISIFSSRSLYVVHVMVMPTTHITAALNIQLEVIAGDRPVEQPQSRRRGLARRATTPRLLAFAARRDDPWTRLRNFTVSIEEYVASLDGLTEVTGTGYRSGRTQ